MKRILLAVTVLVAVVASLSATGLASSAGCAQAPGPNTSYVGSTSVDSANSNGSSFALPGAAQYQLIACGEWRNGPGIHITDAEYLSIDGGWATHQDGYDIAPYFNGPNFGDLMVNNAFVDWGAYSTSHIYSISGSYSGALNLTIFDGNGNNGPVAGKYPSWYGDNSGALQVDVYKVNPRPIDGDQCKKDGWRSYGIFKNQGDCVSYVATGGKNIPAGG